MPQASFKIQPATISVMGALLIASSIIWMSWLYFSASSPTDPSKRNDVSFNQRNLSAEYGPVPDPKLSRMPRSNRENTIERIKKSAQITAFDCDNGIVERSSDFDSCANGNNCMNYKWLMFHQLVTTGVSHDVYSLIRGKAQKYIMIQNSTIYSLACKKVTVEAVKSKSCYAEDVVPVMLNNERKYLGRFNFLLNDAVEKKCNETTTEYTVKQMVSATLAGQFCINFLIAALLYQYSKNSHLDFSTLFNKESLKNFTYLQESFLSGVSPNSTICILLVLYRRIVPGMIFVYTIVSTLWSIVLCGISCAKRLDVITSLSFIFKCLKNTKDLKKEMKIDKKQKKEQLCMQYRSAVGNADKDDMEVTARHLSILYENLVTLTKRVNALEIENKRLKESLQNNEATTDASTVDLDEHLRRLREVV